MSHDTPLERIGWKAFLETAITEFYMPDTVNFVDVGAFCGCEHLETVRISAAMTCNENQTAREYDTGVFEGCSSLTNIIFPEGLTKIGFCWFFVAPIETITIPATVTEIDGSAFRYCLDLKEVKFEEGCSLETIGPSAFKYDESLTEFNFPETLKNIEEHAFQASGLTEVDLPDSLEEMSRAPFADCENLTSVTIPANMNYYWYETYGAFEGCNSLKNVKFKEGVTKIDNGLFGWNEGLESIVIPEGVTQIGARAFRRDYNLKNVTLPESLEKIRYEAFSDCTSLETLTFRGSRPTVEYDICDGVEATVYFGKWDMIPDDWGGDLIFIGETEQEYKEITVTYNHTYGDKKLAETTVSYSDGFFARSNEKYNHELALASLGMGMAGYKKDHINKFLQDCGFQTMAHSKRYGMDKTDDQDQVAFTFAAKQINGKTLIAISLRGGDYGNEWGSNGRVGRLGRTFDYHYGFNQAAEYVLENFRSYCEENSLSLNNTKIWLVGYSRSGAVANLLGQKLENKGLVDEDDLYCYTFATPRTVTEDNAYNVRGIFNIVNPLDIVPCVPLNSSSIVALSTRIFTNKEPWDFTRYGTTLELPSALGTSDYFDQLEVMKEKFLELTNNDEGYERMDGAVLQILLDILARSTGSAETYVKDIQDQIMVPGLELLMAKQGVTTDAAFISLVSMIPGAREMLLRVQWVKNYVLSSDNTKAKKNAADDFVLMRQHWPETYMAWMQTGFIPKEPSTLKSIFVQCPVDVEVYDPDGVLVERIVNDTIDESIEGRLEAYVDEAGTKTVFMPSDAEYTVRLTATDDGEMTYSVREFREDRSLFRKTIFENIPIEKNQVFTGKVNGELETETGNYALESNGEMIEADKDLFDFWGDLNNIEISVEITGDGIVLGDGMYTDGDSVVLEASPTGDNEFVGWYSKDDELLSAEPVMTMVARQPESFKAVFTESSYDPYAPADDPGDPSGGDPDNPSGGDSADQSGGGSNDQSGGGSGNASGGSSAGPAGDSAAKPSATPAGGTAETAIGTTHKIKGNTVKITGADTAAFIKAANKKSVTVPAAVTLDNKTFKVTQVNSKAFTGSKIRTVTIGKNVKKISKNAFAKSKATRIILKTKLLKKKTVKGSLKGSKVKTVQVKVGKKKDNEKYIKSYKKIFTKKNAGKSVKVK